MSTLGWVVTLVASLAVLLGADRVLLAMERRGWIYYRLRKPDYSGGVGHGFLTLQSFVQPGVRHVQEAREAETTVEDEAGEGDSAGS